jgi:hypothetical protein
MVRGVQSGALSQRNEVHLILSGTPGITAHPNVC